MGIAGNIWLPFGLIVYLTCNLHGCSFKFDMNFSSLRRSINSAPYLACVPLSTSRKYAWRLFSTASFDLEIKGKKKICSKYRQREIQGSICWEYQQVAGSQYLIDIAANSLSRTAVGNCNRCASGQSVLMPSLIKYALKASQTHIHSYTLTWAS